MVVHQVALGDYLEVNGPGRHERSCGVVVRMTETHVDVHGMAQDGGLTQWRAWRTCKETATLGDLRGQSDEVKAWVRVVRRLVLAGIYREPVSGVNNSAWHPVGSAWT